MSLLVEEDIIGGVCNFLSSLKFTWISVIKRLYKWKPWLFVLQCRVVKVLDVALSNNKWNLWYSVITSKYLYPLIALIIDNLKLNKEKVWRKLGYENKNRFPSIFLCYEKFKDIIEYSNTNIFTENTFFKLYVNSSQPKHKTIPPTKTKSLEKQWNGFLHIYYF